MSKYTEAEVLNAIKTMGLFRTPYPKDVVENVVYNAFEKADRLEQADACQIVQEKLCRYCYEVETCRREEVGYWCNDYECFVKGASLALTDIRGDNNDGV